MTRDGLTKTSPYDVDALRLLRLVHVRRVLRALCLAEVLAIPAWGGFSLTIEAVYDSSSPAWQRIDDETGPGFLLILLALAATVAVLVATRWLGRAGQCAARLRPIFGRGPEPELGDGAENADAVLARLRRKGFLSLGALFTFLLFALVLVLALMSVWPAWQGNHGHGGPVVTIGKDAHVAYSTFTQTRYGSHRDYFLATPAGTAIAETYHPNTGERWVITRDSFGNLRGYLIGGHDYLVTLLLALLCLAVMAAAVGLQVSTVQTERRLRVKSGGGDLARDVDALAGGGRASLTVPGAPAVVLGLNRLGGRSARSLLLRRRVSSGAVSVVIVGAVVTLLVLQQEGVFTAPPTERSVTLAYLAGSGWDPDAYVFYDEQPVSLDRYRGASTTAPAGATAAAWDVVITRDETPTGSGDKPAANVQVVDIGSVEPSGAATAEVAAVTRAATLSGDAVAPVTGLPADWSGVVDQPRNRVDGRTVWPTVTAVSAARGYLVRVSMSGLYTNMDFASATYSATQVRAWVVSLAAALSRPGSATVALDTVRPQHG